MQRPPAENRGRRMTPGIERASHIRACVVIDGMIDGARAGESAEHEGHDAPSRFSSAMAGLRSSETCCEGQEHGRRVWTRRRGDRGSGRGHAPSLADDDQRVRSIIGLTQSAAPFPRLLAEQPGAAASGVSRRRRRPRARPSRDDLLIASTARAPWALRISSAPARARTWRSGGASRRAQPTSRRPAASVASGVDP